MRKIKGYQLTFPAQCRGADKSGFLLATVLIYKLSGGEIIGAIHHYIIGIN